MPPITKQPEREIIEDFAEEIRQKQLETVKPSKAVINFRNEIGDGVERTVWRVPLDLLRYRKDNGRIASDVLDYEHNVGVLDERDADAQEIIQGFLEDKDPERTEILMQSILHSYQREPAIITCDGFLINGNRRKMVLERLRRDHPHEDAFKYMKAVILPGKGDPGGPPTLLEIEILENRYQLQSDGKSEYYGFDRALSIKRKIELGFTLRDQLRDDPRYARATGKQLTKAESEYSKKYLMPLECVDRYLRQFGREGLYRTISAGMSDKEGRWQAFVDYSNTFDRYLSNSKARINLGIEEEEVGAIEESAFDIIRLRVVPDMPKVHTIMRDLPKYCRTPEGKKAIKKIAEEVEPALPSSDLQGDDGKPLSTSEVDAKWAARNKEQIVYHVKKAAHRWESHKEKETPLELLEAAYKKLIHDDMDITTIRTSDFPKARKLAAKIKDRADKLESEVFHHDKQLRKLVKNRS